ncbi:hypothetical protein EDC24_2941 [Aquisalibacillus elongatus]|uniref:Uncharacterized protein n=1 Tax=Aquisalibacillus elongatus TaxID=485577 RepID=A0A3N5AYV6_9BACI|nr:hypothetical protein EDC24_2941 [Aquisalibacillus elongatus]
MMKAIKNTQPMQLVYFVHLKEHKIVTNPLYARSSF